MRRMNMILQTPPRVPVPQPRVPRVYTGLQNILGDLTRSTGKCSSCGH
jgi:hypothetical protein